MLLTVWVKHLRDMMWVRSRIIQTYSKIMHAWDDCLLQHLQAESRPENLICAFDQAIATALHRADEEKKKVVKDMRQKRLDACGGAGELRRCSGCRPDEQCLLRESCNSATFAVVLGEFYADGTTCVHVYDGAVSLQLQLLLRRHHSSPLRLPRRLRLCERQLQLM